MKTSTPVKDAAGRTWPEIEADLRKRFGGMMLHYMLLAEEAKWMEEQAKARGNEDEEMIYSVWRLRIIEMLTERAEEIEKLGLPCQRIEMLEKTCSAMRHSLMGEGWTEEQLVKAFGSPGMPGTDPGDIREHDGCRLVTERFVMTHEGRFLGYVGRGLKLSAEKDEGWCLQVVDAVTGDLKGLLAWPERWPDIVNSEFLRKQGFEVNGEGVAEPLKGTPTGSADEVGTDAYFERELEAFCKDVVEAYCFESSLGWAEYVEVTLEDIETVAKRNRTRVFPLGRRLRSFIGAGRAFDASSGQRYLMCSKASKDGRVYTISTAVEVGGGGNVEPPKVGTPTAPAAMDDVTKRARLFYYEEAESCWAPLSDQEMQVVHDLGCTFEDMEDGERYEIQLKRRDMTDKEFAEIPEG